MLPIKKIVRHAKRWSICAISICAFMFISTRLQADQHAKSEEQQNEYQFLGRHLIASYYGCDYDALTDVAVLAETMKQASSASGAQLLDSTDYVFPGNGLTMVCLLSESHASIHTYPECGACFIDLFTCGTKCSAEKFDAVLREYLKPKEVDARIIERQ